MFAGVFSAGQGLGFAVGPLLYGQVVELGGYLSSTTGEPMAQAPAAVAAVLLGFAALPAALTTASLLALWRWPSAA